MKFTKQEQSLIKLAAAHMAPQMLKKAMLQDKLAEYGIGMDKKAADYDGKWTDPALSTARIAPQAVEPWAGPIPSRMQRLLNTVQNGMRMVGRPAQMGALAGYTVGSALRGAQPQQSQSADAARGAINEIKTNGWPNVGKGVAPDTRRSDSTGLMSGNGRALPRILAPGNTPLRGVKPAGASATVPATQPAAQAPAGEQTPMIGRPIPDSAPRSGVPRSVDLNIDSKYPYAYQRWLHTPYGEGDGEDAMANVRLFDYYLNRGLDGSNDTPSQKAVEAARGEQADDFARRITSPGTNQYNDAVQMLIQAGRNNQKEFENTGKTEADTTETGGGGIPKNYTGPNRLNEYQLRRLLDLYPAMGDTTNSRRFAGYV